MEEEERRVETGTALACLPPLLLSISYRRDMKNGDRGTPFSFAFCFLPCLACLASFWAETGSEAENSEF